MLAQNFKTAEELGLSEKGYLGLLRVLRMLEGGELIYTPVTGYFEPPNTRNGFNMNSTWVDHECGTVGCIGGWAGFYGKNANWVEGMHTRMHTRSINRLFCPPGRDKIDYTVDQAAKALRSYLVTGEPDWS